jgi:hypothetical protein
MTPPSGNNELSHDVVDSDSMLNEIFDTEQMEVDAVSCNVTLEVTPLPMSEATDMQMFAEDHRNSLHVLDDQDLMIGCAWTTPCEKRLFKMFSEVLHIDCTADTNIECRPLLTISCRDSCGSMFVVLRAFLPNERAWVFRWMFQTVMPRLLGPYISIMPVRNDVVPSHDTPYGVLAPLFKELTSILGHNCLDEKVGKYKRFLSESIAKEKEEFSSSKKHPSGNMISSSGCWM